VVRFIRGRYVGERMTTAEFAAIEKSVNIGQIDVTLLSWLPSVHLFYVWR
jgi:hypothetical protein